MYYVCIHNPVYAHVRMYCIHTINACYSFHNGQYFSFIKTFDINVFDRRKFQNIIILLYNIKFQQKKHVLLREMDSKSKSI